MTSPHVRRLALAFYALATPLAFPHALPGGGAIDLGLVFVWLIPMALFLGIEGRSAREAARSVFLASLVGHVLLFHWFYVVTVSYGGMPAWLGVLSPLVPSLYVSAFSALFAFGWVQLRDGGQGSILSGAALWVCVDWMRGQFLGGFPWAGLGYALHLDVPLLATTRFAGVYGPTFIAVAVGLALARAASRSGAKPRRDLALVAAAIVALHGIGSIASIDGAEEPNAARAAIRIAAVQGNIDQGQKWDEARRNLILEKYFALSEKAVGDGAEWIVWPETAVPGFVELDPGLAERLVEFSSRHGVALIVGGMGVEPDETGTRIGAFFDSAFVFDREGTLVDRYDKTHLVPFGEFVPLRGLLGRFFEALATGLSSMDVTPGARPRVVVWSDPAGDGSNLRVAVPICYELLFPELMRRFGEDGADVMLALTNDAWYGRTGAPHQFLAMTSMRAAENGRWIVRAANTGVSAIIDDRGRVRERSALFEDELVVADVPIEVDRPRTFYARFGDVFTGLCAGWVLWSLRRVIASQRSRREDVAGDEA